MIVCIFHQLDARQENVGPLSISIAKWGTKKNVNSLPLEKISQRRQEKKEKYMENAVMASLKGKSNYMLYLSYLEYFRKAILSSIRCG